MRRGWKLWPVYYYFLFFYLDDIRLNIFNPLKKKKIVPNFPFAYDFHLLLTKWYTFKIVFLFFPIKNIEEQFPLRIFDTNNFILLYSSDRLKSKQLTEWTILYFVSFSRLNYGQIDAHRRSEASFLPSVTIFPFISFVKA